MIAIAYEELGYRPVPYNCITCWANDIDSSNAK